MELTLIQISDKSGIHYQALTESELNIREKQDVIRFIDELGKVEIPSLDAMLNEEWREGWRACELETKRNTQDIYEIIDPQTGKIVKVMQEKTCD